MRVYTAIKEETNEVYSTTSGANLAGFVGCNANYLRDKLRDSPTTRVKGFLVVVAELDRISGRGGFLRDNYGK